MILRFYLHLFSTDTRSVMPLLVASAGLQSCWLKDCNVRNEHVYRHCTARSKCFSVFPKRFLFFRICSSNQGSS